VHLRKLDGHGSGMGSGMGWMARIPRAGGL
jgi:hypothetical protein